MDVSKGTCTGALMRWARGEGKLLPTKDCHTWQQRALSPSLEIKENQMERPFLEWFWIVQSYIFPGLPDITS